MLIPKIKGEGGEHAAGAVLHVLWGDDSVSGTDRSEVLSAKLSDPRLQIR